MWFGKSKQTDIDIWLRFGEDVAMDSEGAYDHWAIRWGYCQATPGTDGDTVLQGIVREGLDRGYLYITDQNARALGTSHALASLWDNGADPLAMLQSEITVYTACLLVSPGSAPWITPDARRVPYRPAGYLWHRAGDCVLCFFPPKMNLLLSSRRESIHTT